jgi:hypothetical protein
VRRTTARAPETGGRGGALPEDRRCALDCCTGHHFMRAGALHEDRKHAHTPRRSGARRGHPRWPAPEGGGSASPASPWSRCCAQEKGKKGAGRFAHHVNRNQVNSQTKGRRRRWSSTIAGWAALRRDRGAAPEGVDGANLWHGRLSERRKKHQRGTKGEKGESFTGDELPRRWRARGSGAV